MKGSLIGRFMALFLVLGLISIGCSDDQGSKEKKDNTPGVLKPPPLPGPVAPIPTEGGEAVSARPPAIPATTAVTPATPAVPAPVPTPEPQKVIDDTAVLSCPEQTAPVAPAMEVIPYHAIFNYVPESIGDFARCSGTFLDSFLINQLNDKTEEFKNLQEEVDAFLDYFCISLPDVMDMLVGYTSLLADTKVLVAGKLHEAVDSEGCETLKNLTTGDGEALPIDFPFAGAGEAYKVSKVGSGATGTSLKFKIAKESTPDQAVMYGYISPDNRVIVLTDDNSLLSESIDAASGVDPNIRETAVYTFYEKLKSTATCDGVGRYQEIFPDYLKLYEEPYIAFKMNTVNAESRSRRSPRTGMMQLSAALYPDIEEETWHWSFNADIKSATISKFFQMQFAQQGASGKGSVRPANRPPAGPAGGGVGMDAATLLQRIVDVEKALGILQGLNSQIVTEPYLRSLSPWLLEEVNVAKLGKGKKTSDLLAWLGAKLTELKDQLDALPAPAGKTPVEKN